MTMLTTAMLIAVLEAEPTGFVVLARQGVPNEELKRALATLDAELARAGVEAWTVEETSKRLKAAGGGDAASCNGKTACLAALGVKLQVAWLVTVSVTKLGRDRAWVLEAVDVKASAPGAREEWLDETNTDISESAARFSSRLSKSMKPADVPVVAKLEPPPPPVQPPLVSSTPEPAPSGKVLPKVLVVGAGLAGAAAIGLAIGAASASSQLGLTSEGRGPNMEPLSRWTAMEAANLVAASNGFTVGAIIAAVVGLGLGVGTVLTW
jgi:hypothetical protein